MVTRTFQRTKPYAYVKLGRRTKLRYKRPTGRHNKSRQKWRSRPPMVEIGYKHNRAQCGLINGKTPVIVNNIHELRNVGKNQIAILAKIGKKNKIEIAKEALAKKIEIFNLNIAKFLKECEREEKMKKKEGTKVETKKEEKKHEHKEEKKDEHKPEEAKSDEPK